MLVIYVIVWGTILKKPTKRTFFAMPVRNMESRNLGPSDSVPLQISEHYILPLSLPPLPSFPTRATHYLYISKHKPKIPTPTAPRSLFLVNVPFDATDAHIKHLLSTQLGIPNGRIEEVHFEDQKIKTQDHKEALIAHHDGSKNRKKRKRPVEERSADEIEGARLPSTWDRDLHGIGRTAVVKFVDRASVEVVIKALKSVRKNGRQLTWGEGLESALPALGFASMRCASHVKSSLNNHADLSKGYLNHHNLRYPNKVQLIESVNNYMTAFAAQESSRAKLQAKQRQEPDEDGFVMVTRGGRNGPARLDMAQEQAEKQKVRQKGLEDFYRFQTREKKKAKAGELVRKFEEDKEKVRRMRERRQRFKVKFSTCFYTHELTNYEA